MRTKYKLLKDYDAHEKGDILYSYANGSIVGLTMGLMTVSADAEPPFFMIPVELLEILPQ